MSTLDIERETLDSIDREIARLFEKRMQCVEKIAEIKRHSGAPVFDPVREKSMLESESMQVAPKFRPLYRQVLGTMLSVSKQYQRMLLTDDTECVKKSLSVTTGSGAYEITVKRGAIESIGEIFDLERKVLVVTDSGVPEKYAQKVASCCAAPVVVTLDEGESTKCIATFEMLEKTMLDSGFCRDDCVVAVGGGVVGDIAGFAASAYMRGIDFYNVPTTLLSQVDSSIGGKTAVNFGATKNIIGAFYPPRAVAIDPDTLSTLDKRNIASGLAECIKSALIGDEDLLNIIEKSTGENVDEIIFRALKVKKRFVELDEKESGVRRALNFGHTIGHAIEMQSGLLHGESVALGMLPMVSGEIRERITAIYEKLGLPTNYDVPQGTKELIKRDKKATGELITAVAVNTVGTYEFVKMTPEEIEEKAREVLAK